MHFPSFLTTILIPCLQYSSSYSQTPMFSFMHFPSFLTTILIPCSQYSSSYSQTPMFSVVTTEVYPLAVLVYLTLAFPPKKGESTQLSVSSAVRVMLLYWGCPSTTIAHATFLPGNSLMCIVVLTPTIPLASSPYHSASQSHCSWVLTRQ